MLEPLGRSSSSKIVEPVSFWFRTDDTNNNEKRTSRCPFRPSAIAYYSDRHHWWLQRRGIGNVRPGGFTNIRRGKFIDGTQVLLLFPHPSKRGGRWGGGVFLLFFFCLTPFSFSPPTAIITTDKPIRLNKK